MTKLSVVKNPWRMLDASRKRDALRMWETFTTAYLAVDAEYDEAISGMSVAQYLSRVNNWLKLEGARMDYVLALFQYGILLATDSVPDDNLLYESHPMNLRSEIDNQP